MITLNGVEQVTATGVNSSVEASLPTAGIAARLYRVTDGVRGLRMDQGSQWFGLNGDQANVCEFGATGNGTTNDTTAIQAAINAIVTEKGTLVFPPGTYLCGNLTITDGVDICLRGPGATITWTGTASGSNYIGLQLLGTCTNLEIRNLRFTGDGVVANRHAGLWTISNAGLALTNIRMIRNHIYNVVNGIRFDADTSGAFTNLKVYQNHLDTMVGTASGQGYGIVHTNGSGNASHLTIDDNYIIGAQRHSIYQASGRGVTITNNKIKNHRTGQSAPGSQLPAIVIARSSDVLAAMNFMDAPQDGAIEVISQAGAAISPTRNILVKQNIILNPTSTFPSLIVGASDPSTDGVVEEVVIDGNSVYQSGSNTSPLYVFSGKQVDIKNNVLVMLGVTGLTTIVDIWGKGEVGATANYTDNIVFTDNRLYGTEGGGGQLYAIGLESAVATSATRIDIGPNHVSTPRAVFYCAAALTDPNVRVIGTPATGVSNWKPAVLAPVESGSLLARYGNPAALSVSSNTITITGSYHRIDTSTGAQTLKTINGGNVGDELILQSSSAANPLTVDETGNIALGASSRSLDHSNDVLKFIKGVNAWCEVAFANND